MALYHKWDVKNDFAYVLQFFSLISDSLGSVIHNVQGTIHLRRQHVLGGEGCPHGPMVKRSQYIRIKNPLHKHFAGMPMVGG